MTNPNISTPAGYVPATAVAFANPDGTSQLVSAAQPLPVSGSISLGGSSMGVTASDGALATIGAMGDAAASADTGSFSLMAMTKRLVAKLTVGQKPMAQSLAVTLASDQSTVPVSVTGSPSVTVGNFPATQAVSGAVSVSNLPATQAVSAAALPLPTGAATAALQTQISGQLPASIGQKAMAASLPVAIASDQTNLEPGGIAITGTTMPTGGTGLTGWLSAIYKACMAAIPPGTSHIGSVSLDDVADGLVTTASVTSATTVVSVLTQGFAGGAFQVSNAGTTCIVTYEQSNDNVNWYALPVISMLSGTNSPTTTTTAVGLYAYISSAAYVRARVSTYTSGTVTISLAQKRVAPPTVGVSLAASTSAIGSVTVTTLPALPTGGNTVGNTNTATGYTDSITSLAASATYSGTGRTTNSNAQYAFFNASAYADQAGTLYIDQSLDTGATYLPVASTAVAAVSSGQISVRLTGTYTASTLYRVRYVNGATAQTTFRIASAFSAR